MSFSTEHPTENKVCVFCVTQFPHEITELCKSPSDNTGDISDDIKDVVTKSVGRPQSDPSQMEDALSSGRKRAAEIAPIPVGMVCEWACLRYAGGGVEPIKGCVGNPATNRHHGPDKNTLNNELGVNLHRICAHCHNRWHATNDKYYQGERPKDDTPWLPVGEWNPHDAEHKMSKKEALIEELQRS